MKIRDFITKLQEYDLDTEILGDFYFAQDIVDNADISMKEAKEFIKHMEKGNGWGDWGWGDIETSLNDWELKRSNKSCEN